MEREPIERKFVLDPHEKLIRSKHRSFRWGRISALAAVLLCLLGTVLLLLPSHETAARPSKQRAEKVSLLSRPTGEILKAEFVSDGETYTLSKGQNGWHCDLIPDMYLDQTLAGRVMVQCTSVSGTLVTESGAEANVDYGFASAEDRLTLTYSDGQSIMMTVGNNSPVGGRYARVSDREQVVLIPESVTRTVFTGLNSLHTVVTPALREPLSPTRILVERAENGQFTQMMEIVKRENPVLSGSGYRFTFPFAYEMDAEQTAALITDLSSIRATKYLGREKENPASAVSGYRVTLQDSTGASVEMLLDVPKDEKTSPCVFFNGEEDRYAVDASALLFLSKLDPASLADRFVALIALEKVKSLEIDAGKEKWLLENREEGYFVNGKRVESTAFRMFWMELSGLTADDAAAKAEEGEEILSFTYVLSGKDEPYRVRFLTSDPYRYRIERDGESLMVIAKTKLDAIIQLARELEK